MDLVYGESDSQERPGNCRSVSSRSRARFRALFNASQGRYLGYQFLQYLEQPDELYARAARHGVNVVAMAMPTPSATGTPLPSATDGPTPTLLPPGRPTADLAADGPLAQPLATGDVPALLVDAVREMAEVPGSYWVYRVTELNEGVHWSQRIFTDTISSSRQVAPDVILNQHNVPGASWLGSGREPWPNCYDLSHYLVFPNGRVAPNDTWSGPVKLADMRRLLPGPPEHEESGCRGQAVAALVLPFTENRTFSNPEDHWGTGERASIDVPAGHFEGCYAVHNGTADSQPSIHWTCPGVGVVRHELPGCHMFGGGFTLYELIDYRIPPIVPAPGSWRSPASGRHTARIWSRCASDKADGLTAGRHTFEAVDPEVGGVYAGRRAMIPGAPQGRVPRFGWVRRPGR